MSFVKRLLGLLAIAVSISHAATFSVDNINDAGAGSLRQAVLDANVTTAADTIQFAIPGAGPHNIILQTSIGVLQPSTMDGFSQAGSAPNTLAQGG
jgi:hypothetical protein